jgi:hypothetical protein
LQQSPGNPFFQSSGGYSASHFVTGILIKGSLRDRHLVGIIQNVNALAQEAELLQPGKENPLRLTWDKQTRFVANQHFVDAAILSSGARVEVVCIRPFFGTPYVTKVTLLLSSTPHDNKIK